MQWIMSFAFTYSDWYKFDENRLDILDFEYFFYEPSSEIMVIFKFLKAPTMNFSGKPRLFENLEVYVKISNTLFCRKIYYTHSRILLFTAGLPTPRKSINVIVLIIHKTISYLWPFWNCWYKIIYHVLGIIHIWFLIVQLFKMGDMWLEEKPLITQTFASCNLLPKIEKEKSYFHSS